MESCEKHFENKDSEIMNYGESLHLSKEKNWNRFSEWVHCMCVVTFDLELGQAIEIIYPEKFSPNEQEKINICYLAFPDSNSGCMGDTQFHVRLRTNSDSKTEDYKSNSLSFAHKLFNTRCLPIQKADKAHYWGFVYFRQRKESSLPRGYLQKSFIILTRLPFFNLFYEIVSQLAPKYFEQGFGTLESACNQICDWPPLRAGELLKLPLFDTVYQTLIPLANSKCFHINGKINSASKLLEANNDHNLENQHKSSMHSGLQTKVIASVSEIDVFRSLSCVISHIFTLWELVLTSEPIVVMGSSPEDTSHMVQSLVSLIAPLEYCAESRPYFTIHDSEFREYTREYGQFTIPPAIIIGVTNPFFVKLLKDWPHMIRISMTDSQINQSFGSSLHPTMPTSLTGTPPNTGAVLYGTQNSSRRVSSENATSVTTKYKPFLKKDKAFIKKIMLGLNTKRPLHVQTALLRRSFLELTQSFMIPLERYMASLMPFQKDISPFKSAPTPHPFKQNNFLATLDHSGPHLTSPLKGNWKGLYKRFFNSSNFKGWYETRHRELQLALQELQLQALSEADLTQWAQGKQEVEIVDMIIKLKQKLDQFSTENINQCMIVNEEVVGTRQFNETKKKLLHQIESMKQSLPEDLKTILFKS